MDRVPMTVNEIVQMTGYTRRLIQMECKAGRLKATCLNHRQGWQIAHADYVAWRSVFKAWRKPYKRGKSCSTSI